MSKRMNYNKDEMVTASTTWGSVVNPTEGQTIKALDTAGIDGDILGVSLMWTGTAPFIASLVKGASMAYPLSIGAQDGVFIPITGRVNFEAGNTILVAASMAGTGTLVAAIVYSVG